jgi:PAS domain-containing protein/DNA-binding CsgD family transcriptional regulator
MPDRDLSTLVGSFYEAVTGTSDWTTTGEALCEVIGAQSAILSVRQSDGRSVNLLSPTDPGELDYNDRYRLIDPIRPLAETIRVDGDWLNAVRFSDEILPVEAFRQSEFYRDFARHHGQDYMMIGALGDVGRSLLVLYRDRIPFTDTERLTLSRLLPHALKTLELRKRLGVDQRVATFQAAALEASASRILVVDAGLQVHYANRAALEAIESRNSSLTLRRSLMRLDGCLGELVARNGQDTVRLRQAIVDAAGQSRSSAFRLAGLPDAEHAVFDEACYACPLPQDTAIPGLPAALGLAMLVVQALRPPAGPPPSLLMELFGLSGSEAGVAVAMLGGRSAEEVAAERRVSLDTVRTQLRAVLRKSDASNLRDFERICAMLRSLERRPKVRSRQD